MAPVRGRRGARRGGFRALVCAGLGPGQPPQAVPLGQSAGQRILARLAAAMPEAVAQALRTGDADRQAFSPMLAILSAQRIGLAGAASTHSIPHPPSHRQVGASPPL